MLNLGQNLKPQPICIHKLFLDPNNPRFLDFEDEIGLVPDERITEENVQSYAMERMSKFDLRELKDSVAEVGFLPMDKMVVRPIGDGNFVVVEGNRRLAAVKSLLGDHQRGREVPEELLEQLKILAQKLM